MRIYISCPMSVPDRFLTWVSNALTSLGNNVRYWRRGTEYAETKYIQQCDVFCIILPDNSFKHYLHSLPTGTRKELVLAEDLHKTIILAYATGAGEMCFYNTTIEDGVIKGVAGTYNNILEMFSEQNVSKAPVSQTSGVINNTLLLLCRKRR
jgi:hypothetical protein